MSIPSPSTSAETTATPVAVVIADGRLAAAVTRHVEGVLGWQVVEDTPGLPAQLRLVDAAAAEPGAVAVLPAADVEMFREATAAGADDVLVWPQDVDRLALLSPRQSVRVAGQLLPVGGAGGGVGTTTAALLIAATYAWTGSTTWLVTGEDGWRSTGMDPDRMTVRAVTAAPGLSLARSMRDLHGRTAADDHVVIDVGTDHRRRVLVARPDRRLIEATSAIGGCTPGPAKVLTVGPGGLRPAELRRVVTGRAHLHIDHDERIARAAIRGGLPGRFPGRLVQDVVRWLGRSGAARESTARGSIVRGHASSALRVGDARGTAEPSRGAA